MSVDASCCGPVDTGDVRLMLLHPGTEVSGGNIHRHPTAGRRMLRVRARSWDVRVED